MPAPRRIRDRRTLGGAAVVLTAAATQVLARYEREDLLAEAESFGVELHEVDPGEALLVAVAAAAARLQWLRERSANVRVPAERIVSAEMVALAGLERQTLDMLVRASKAALDAGVAKRRVELAEEQGIAIGDAAAAAMAAIGLAPELQAQFAREFLARLAVLTHEADAVEPVIEHTERP